MSETSTEGVRDHFGGPPFDGIGGAGRQWRLAVFDRWLAATKAEVKAAAWDEGAKAAWERSTPEVNARRYHWRSSGEPRNPYESEARP